VRKYRVPPAWPTNASVPLARRHVVGELSTGAGALLVLFVIAFLVLSGDRAMKARGY